jgi:dienelactone hydrolase
MKISRWISVLALAGFHLLPIHVAAADDRPIPAPAAALNAYFEQQVKSLEGQLDRDVKTREDWLAKKDEYRRQLFEMVGLDPMPPRTDLRATKTGEFEHDGLIVEKWHYQSMPGLYVTANVYRPKTIDKPLPAVLYVCGHGEVVKNGIHYGSKAAHQSHALWYARHGFVCMVIDTLGLGEIHGEHHGTARLDRWWWFARGYTPAGVEAWNCIRGLDYLETRPDVDKTRFGVAGMSGGGAYSWWLSSLDERIKAAVPTSGITDLRNYVVDGCVEHHCDCMFFVNTYRWDYDKVAALDAPRALCIANPDKDMYFPIDGVFRIYQHARRVYKLLGQENEIGMQFNEGPHQDTQPLNTGEFHWMTRFLQDAPRTALFDTSTHKEIEVEKLRVFTELPKDQRNSTIDETFVPLAARPTVPRDAAEWAEQRDGWMKALREKCFRGWPKTDETKVTAGETYEKDGVHFSTLDMMIEGCFPIRLIITQPAGLKPEDLQSVILGVMDEAYWRDFASAYAAHVPGLFPKDLHVKPNEPQYAGINKEMSEKKSAWAFFCPRGIGPTRWDSDAESDTAHPKEAAAARLERIGRLRRFYLIGQTLESGQVWDIRCAIHALRSMEGLKGHEITLTASGNQAANVLYASLFEKNIGVVIARNPPHSHRLGPTYLNVLKYVDLPQTVAMAAERTHVLLIADDPAAWDFTRNVSDKLAWGLERDNGVVVVKMPDAAPNGK